MKLSDFLDDTGGVDLRLPADLMVEDIEAEALHLRGSHGEVVTIRRQSLELVVHPSMIDIYRHDLRLDAASIGGGLVECDIMEGVGVIGITKHKADAPRGFAYLGEILVPAESGFLSMFVTCQEGSLTGLREGVAAARMEAKYGSNCPEGWRGDPYGYEFEETPENFLKRFRWRRRHEPYDSRKLTLWTRSDDRQYDIPGHPLTVVRARLNDLVSGLRSSARLACEPALRASDDHGFSFDLPPGFRPLAGGELSHGRVYARASFNRTTTLAVCGQPDFPNCAHSPRAAKEMERVYAGMSGLKLARGPVSAAAVVGGHRGIRCEMEGERQGKSQYWASFCIPGRRFPIQVGMFGRPDDRARLDQQLSDVVASLSREANEPAAAREVQALASSFQTTMTVSLPIQALKRGQAGSVETIAETAS